MGGLILDTAVLVAAERERFDLEALVEREGQGGVYLAAITVSELLHGAERASSDRRRGMRRDFVTYLGGRFPVLAFTAVTARHHAQLWATLVTHGTMIGYYDLLIAATALEVGAAVATLNRREFERVPGLALADVEPYVRR